MRPALITLVIIMNISELDWSQTPHVSGTLHQARSTANEPKALAAQVDAAVDKILERLPYCIDNNSRYLLCQWDSESACLTLLATDDTKSLDSSEQVALTIDAWAKPVNAEQSEELLFWIKDYLPVCRAFTQFSLIAIWCEDNRHHS